jgi:hypothetical protein
MPEFRFPRRALHVMGGEFHKYFKAVKLQIAHCCRSMPSRMITSHLGGFYGQKGRITKGCLGYFLKQDSQT